MKHPWELLSVFGIVVLDAVLVVALDESFPRIIEKTNFFNSNNGNYNYKYKFDNGVMEIVEGKLKSVNNVKIYTVIGSYEYPSDNGKIWSVEYVADESGYHAVVSLRGLETRKEIKMPNNNLKMATFLREFHKNYFKRKYIIF